MPSLGTVRVHGVDVAAWRLRPEVYLIRRPGPLTAVWMSGFRVTQAFVLARRGRT